MYCRVCGQQIPDNSTFCNSCGAQQYNEPQSSPQAAPPASQPTPQVSKPDNGLYKALCWCAFAFCILLGIVSLVNSGGEDRKFIHGIVMCLTSLIFSPAITVKSLERSPIGLFVIKLLVAFMIVIFI